MIDISHNVSKGDIVTAWFLPPTDRTKKPIESEYRLGEVRDGWLQLHSLGGGYSMVFDRSLIEEWNGSVKSLRN